MAWSEVNPEIFSSIFKLSVLDVFGFLELALGGLDLVLQGLVLFLQVIQLLVDAFLFLLDPAFEAGDLAAALFELLFGILFEAVDFVLCFDDCFFFLCFSSFDSVADNALRFFIGGAERRFRCSFTVSDSQRKSDDNSDQYGDYNRNRHGDR